MRFQWKQESAHPWRGKLLLDGYDASGGVRGFHVKSSVEDITTVELDLVVLHGADPDTEAMVLIPGPVVEVLTRFGWTPPPGAEVRGGAMCLERIQEREPDPLDMVDTTTYGSTAQACSCTEAACPPHCICHLP